MENQPILPSTAPQPTESRPQVSQSLAPSEHKRSKKPLFGALLVILLIACVAYGTYAWQHKKVTNLDMQVTSLSKQVASLKKVTSFSATAGGNTTTPSQATANSTTTVFKIPELGIQVTVPNGIKDILYKVNNSSTLST